MFPEKEDNDKLLNAHCNTNFGNNKEIQHWHPPIQHLKAVYDSINREKPPKAMLEFKILQKNVTPTKTTLNVLNEE